MAKGLTEAQRSVYELAAQGMPTSEIAARLGISVGAVGDRIRQSERKMGARLPRPCVGNPGWKKAGNGGVVCWSKEHRERQEEIDRKLAAAPLCRCGLRGCNDCIPPLEHFSSSG